MSIIQNNKKISNVYINNKKISKIYYNNKLIYQSQPLYAQIVFRNIDENGNISLPQENINNYFDNITSIETRGLYYAFYNCSGLTGSISFPQLTSIGNYGLRSAFDGCSGLTGSISFPKLTSIGNYGLYYAFTGCSGLTGSISFPQLTSIGNDGLAFAFRDCGDITELHFRADMQSVIENQSDYSNNFGAYNSTIYFDL